MENMVEGNQDNLNLRLGETQEKDSALPRARRDLEITEQIYYGKPCYLVEDPISLRC